MNKAAQALGRLAKGVPKTLTAEQRTFRAEQLAQARKKRHGKPKRVTRRSNSMTTNTYKGFIRRKGWHNWQEAVTVIRETPNGWRIRWESGYKTGKCATVTRRNWEVEPIKVQIIAEPVNLS